MTPHDLIAAFDTLAEAPEGVTRLRELVLQLAVRGKLVPQDPEDEPASVLLERIAAEKARLHEIGEIRKPKALPRVSADEVPFDVPEGWVWARFADVANIASNLVEPQDHPDAPHVAPDSIEKATGRLLGYRSVAEDDVRSSKHLFYPGQILYSKIRPNLSKVVTVDFGGLCSADMYPIDPWLDRGYLHRYMLAGPFLVQVVADDNRLAMPKVNQEQLSAVLVSVPPLAEQHRIVARVDELMGLLDRLEAARNAREATRTALRDAALAALRDADTPEEVEVAWERIAGRMDDLFTDPADVEPLRQAVLQLAVRGRLAPQNPEDEPASALLERIAATRCEGWIAGEQHKRKHADKSSQDLAAVYVAPRPRLDAIDQPLPDGWRWSCVEALTHPTRTVSYGILKPGPDTPDGVPYVKVRDIKDGRILVDGLRRTTKSIHSEYLRSELAAGDVLVSIRGTVGKVAVVPAELRGGNITQDTARLAVLEGMVVSFLVLVLRSPLVQSYFARFQKGAAVQGLNIGDLRPAPIPVPPLAEQKRIVAKVDELMSLLDRLEKHLADKTTAHDAFAAAAVHHLDA